MYVYIYIDTYIYIHTHVYMPAGMHACMNAYIRTYRNWDLRKSAD